MIPLAERNWAAMTLALVTLILLASTAVVLWTIAPHNSEPWVWVTTSVFTVASLSVTIGLITGDIAWFLIGLILSRSR